MQVLDPGWSISSWFEINKRAGGGRVAIRMSWCTFFAKKLVGGRDVYSGLESIVIK